MAVVRPISPGALVNATSSMAIVSRESSVHSVNEECKLNDSKLLLSTGRVENKGSHSTREITPEDPMEQNYHFDEKMVGGNDENDNQALNLSTHSLTRSARGESS